MYQIPGYSIAIAIIAIMLAISGIIIGIGMAMDDKKLKEFGRSELYQSVINGIIVGSLIAIFAQNGIIYNIEYNMVANMSNITCSGIYASNYAICFANQFLVGTIPMQINGQLMPTVLDSIIAMITPLTAIYGILSSISSITISIVVLSINLSTVLQPLIGQIDYAIEALTFSMLSIEVQSIILQFIATTALTVLMPIGIVLRSFYFTRRLGGAILAITIALFTILPMSYLLDAQLMYNYSNGQYNSMSSITSLANSLQGNVNGVVTNNNISKTALLSVENSISNFMQNAESTMTSIWIAISTIIVEAFFLPIFSLILTIISARELARIMGSEISFSRFDIM